MACPTGSIPYSFDRKNPAAIRWARQQGARLITDIKEETRKAIRIITSEALSQGIAPVEQAKLIRNVIGLTERQSETMMKLRKKIINSPGTTVELGKLKIRVPVQGMSKTGLENALKRYSDRALRSRALGIARTETMDASNEGQLRMWRKAKADGVLSEKAERVWIATAGACPLCEALDGEVVSIEGGFTDEIERPPRHPYCRCTTGLTF